MNFVIVLLFACIVRGPCLIIADFQDELQSLNFDDYEARSNRTPTFESLIQQSRNKEGDLERAQKVSRNFERMIQLVNILGQIDSFLSERTKLILRKLALLANDDDGYQRRRS